MDVHIKRVWKRAGLGGDLSVAGIMRAATELKPNYPVELGYPAWIIGMAWWHPRGADCWGEQHEDAKGCPLRGVCPKIGAGSSR